MHNDLQYEICTHWGWFRLDEGAYRDYLGGKLWISSKPAGPEQGRVIDTAAPLPANVSERAVQLRERAGKNGFYDTLRQLAPGQEITVPYRGRMGSLPIDEMNLSVRASNGLMRAGASSFAALKQILEREGGLRSIRNLGAKSEKEISTAFLSACYAQLGPGEKAQFWQELLDRGILRDV